MWFLDRPANNEDIFSRDSSWKVIWKSQKLTLTPVEADEYAAAFVKRLEGPIIFLASNGYGLSARGIDAGEQLTNTRADEDKFRVHNLGDNTIKIESLSSPGLYIGVGAGFKAVLVSDSDPSCHLRLAPPRNQMEGFISFESVQHPGFLLNHCNGKMWFFDRPANNEATFSADSSWKVSMRLAGFAVGI